MKVLLIVIDGLGDRGKNGTPLQNAKKKNLNTLAKNGFCAVSFPLGPGIVPGSDTGHLSLLGYDPKKYYVGRGIIEALGANVKIYEGDVAFRANFATLERSQIIDRRAGRISHEDAQKLSKEIEHIEVSGFDFYFQHTKGHRGVVIVRGKKGNASPLVTDTDPHCVGKAPYCKSLNEEGIETAKAINEWTKKVNKILSESEINKERKKKKIPVANVVLLRGGSSLVEGKYFEGAKYFGPYVKEPVRVETFKEKYELSSSCIAGGALYKGIGKYLGMEVKDSEKFTADENTDLDGKFSLAVSELKKNDFVFLHIKGCDPLSHDGKFDEKRKFIEKIDKKLDFIFDLEDTLTVITSDHSTPCVLKSHSSDPVPVLFYGWERKNCKEFHETCSDFLINHIDVMPIILGIIGKAKMFGT